MSPRSRRYVGRFAILVKAESMDLDGTEGKAFFEENEALTRQRGCAVRENRPPPQLWLNMRSERPLFKNKPTAMTQSADEY